jgi:AraC-like DNA-binding protein
MAVDAGADSIPRRDAKDADRYNDLTALIQVTAAGSLHPKIRHAVRFIDRNFQRKLTLRSVADRIAFHPNYLCRRFREELGMSFSEYLVRVRLKQAIGGLIYTDDPIKAVAFRAGFAGPERFARVFRSWLQCSPRAFRARYRYGELDAKQDSQKS